jgi:pimeloyl-ACP methyl ester carboxylesterase
MEHLRKAPYSGLVEAMNSGLQYDFLPMLDSIRVPALVCHGRRDTGRTAFHLEAFRRGLPRATVVEFECGHYPMEEASDEFTTAVVSFLRGLDGPASTKRPSASPS